MDHGDPLVVRSSRNHGVLRVEVSGPGTYANTLAYWKTLVAAVNEQTPRGLLLIDITTGTELSPQEWKALVDAVSGKGLEAVRVAHVKPHGLQQIEFCELYAREAGITARVFTDEAEADLWLRYGASEPVSM